jgi:hypothetical protein
MMKEKGWEVKEEEQGAERVRRRGRRENWAYWQQQALAK